jgi:hypothetical protein
MVRSGERAGAQHRSGAASFNNTFYISRFSGGSIEIIRGLEGHGSDSGIDLKRAAAAWKRIQP